MQQSITMYSSSTPTITADEQSSTEPTQLSDLLATPGSWSREARSTVTLAHERGLCLDDERLIYSDVRDLITLQRLLREIEIAPVHHLPRELASYVCA